MNSSEAQDYRKARLEQFLEQVFKGQKAALGRALGYKDGSFVGQMLRGERSISEATVEQIENLPDGKGWFGSAVELAQPSEDDFALVQQLDVAASCGTGRFVEHVVVKGGLAFKKSSLRDFGLTEESARIIYASGGSMEPTIQDGCVVLLNTADTAPREGRVFAICQPDGDLVLKRLVMDYIPALGAQGWVMRSDNADKNKHPDKILPPDARTMIVGRAVWNDNRL